MCGTDHEIARFEYGTPPAGEPYLVIGHESLGEVVEVGSAVSGIKPGDLVVTDGAPPLRPARVPPVPARSARLLPDGRLHRARHQGAARLHDRRGRRPREEHAPRPAARSPTSPSSPSRSRSRRRRSTSSTPVLTRMPWIDPDEGGEARPQRRRARRGAGRPAGRAGAAGAGLRHLGLLARERQERARRIGSRASAARYIESATLPVAQLGKRVGNVDLHSGGDRLGRPGHRGPARDRRERRHDSHRRPRRGQPR